MSMIKAFRGVRPKKELADRVACRPYDVLTTEEARAEAEGNPHSFLRVVKSEICFPKGADPYGAGVYAAARANYDKMLADRVLSQDPAPCLYAYRMEAFGRTQTAIVACVSVDDFLAGKVKKHELTRPEKENDRKTHIRTTRLHAEPVFFFHEDDAEVEARTSEITDGGPEYDFTAADGVRHTIWIVRDARRIAGLEKAFSAVSSLYIADGHHRSAASVALGTEMRDENKAHRGDEPYYRVMALIYPQGQLRIMDYNRLARDLGGLSPTAFLGALDRSFSVSPMKKAGKPSGEHEMAMYMREGGWRMLKVKPGLIPEDPQKSLDVSLLTDLLLAPVLGIKDLRRDPRIDFSGGIAGLPALEKRVDSREMAVAFAMHPVSMARLREVSDAGLIMPPKSTWFEPKPRSGLIVHSLDA